LSKKNEINGYGRFLPLIALLHTLSVLGLRQRISGQREMQDLIIYCLQWKHQKVNELVSIRKPCFRMSFWGARRRRIS